MTHADTYPGLWRACFAITVANGGLHRERPEERIKEEFCDWLALSAGVDLLAIDAWLATLDESDLETVTDGEASKADALLKSAPANTQALLNDYFDKVC